MPPRSSCSGLQVNLQQCRYEVLREVSERAGYQVTEGEEETWDLCWTDLSVSIERVQRLKPFQRLNHFPAMLEICRKSALSRHLHRMHARLPAEYGFYPHSMVLPDQLEELIGLLKKNKAKAEQGADGLQTFILKPSNGTMGRGIHLVQSVSQIQDYDINNVVAQAYVENPLLLDGFKFDLRIYALVLSVDPLKVYLYDEGLARLATQPYEVPDTNNLKSSIMHLTNYSINKHSPHFVYADDTEQGHKRLASAVLQQVADQQGCSKHRLVQDIASIIIKTILSIQPLLSHTYHTCFEVLGFDIMFDDQLQPWLLEVNHSPSFACDSKLDKQVKTALLLDTLLALGQRHEDKSEYLERQQQALNERLYNPATATVRRPLSAFPKSKQMQAAAAVLDGLTNSSSALLNTSAGSHSSASSRTRASSATNGHGAATQQAGRYNHEDSGEVINGSYGLLGSMYANRIGRYGLIFPMTDDFSQKRYSKIMQVAADAFPDQRCQCVWCARRRELKFLSASGRELSSAAERRASSAAGFRPRSRYSGSARAGTSSTSTSTSASFFSASASAGRKHHTVHPTSSAKRKVAPSYSTDQSVSAVTASAKSTVGGIEANAAAAATAAAAVANHAMNSAPQSVYESTSTNTSTKTAAAAAMVALGYPSPPSAMLRSHSNPPAPVHQQTPAASSAHHAAGAAACQADGTGMGTGHGQSCCHLRVEQQLARFSSVLRPQSAGTTSAAAAASRSAPSTPRASPSASPCSTSAPSRPSMSPCPAGAPVGLPPRRPSSTQKAHIGKVSAAILTATHTTNLSLLQRSQSWSPAHVTPSCLHAPESGISHPVDSAAAAAAGSTPPASKHAHSLVPRVALLPGTRSSMIRAATQSFDRELIAMQIRTAVLLSNRFISMGLTRDHEACAAPGRTLRRSYSARSAWSTSAV